MKRPLAMMTAWATRRARMSHDALKNLFLPALAKFSRILEGSVEDSAFRDRIPEFIAAEWARIRDEAVFLARDYRESMSPRALFNEEPLSHTPPDTMAWLPDLIHNLWLQRHPVDAWERNAVAAVSAAQTAVDGLLALLRGSADDSQLLAATRKLADACRQVSLAFQAFPNRIVLSASATQ